MKEIPYAKLIAAVLVLTAITSVIMLIPNWNGEQASTAAADIDRLLDVMIVLSSFVFSIVMVMLGYAVFKWRVKPGDEGDGEPIHGNTRLEITWTVIPTVIVLFGAVYAGIVLADIEKKDADRMPLQVTAQQFAWSFAYPEQGVVADELHVPVDQQLEITLRAEDVLHSFWVPEWRIKRDLVPGAPGSNIADEIVITPNVIGSYSVICTEYCGTGHSTMRVPVEVESEADFLAWAAKQEKLDPATLEDDFVPDTNGPKTE